MSPETLVVCVIVFIILLVISSVFGYQIGIIFFVLAVLFPFLYLYMPKVMVVLEILLVSVIVFFLAVYFPRAREADLVIEMIFIVLFLLVVIVLNSKD